MPSFPNSTPLARTSLCAVMLIITSTATADTPGEEGALGPPDQRIRQEQIEQGKPSLRMLRTEGLEIFSAPFNQIDGFGDGPENLFDTTSPGGRPTLQGNGTFLRINGLDSQSCLECHSLISADTRPATLGVGGAGGLSTSAMFMPRTIDVSDQQGLGEASFDGRLINPPALFGTGAVQVLAQEMTTDLQALKAQAIASPGSVILLRSKGVDFGQIVALPDGSLDTSGVHGIDADLVVRPFGRKGEFATVRQFDQGALMFHMGMQPVEVVGEGVDEDNDGVVNEVLIGEVSALEIFITTQDSPRQLRQGHDARRGFTTFNSVGCADCHRPVLETNDPKLRYRFPEIDEDPSANVFYQVDLRRRPMRFRQNRAGGVDVPLFSDLKRHDMGDLLAESFSGTDDGTNREFITAKLWGVADTAPYLHDGRALTLNQAIELHGGEAQAAADAYRGLSDVQRQELQAFLKTLRNPRNPNRDVITRQR